ncbi:MAG: phospho-sugar mutase [Acetivibrio ethanolgignens]
MSIQRKEKVENVEKKRLAFGTGGLRGVLGPDSDQMNYGTVGQATQGLANYIIKKNGQDRGVAIAFDSRRMSPEFAECAALCLNANGIKTYCFESLRPTPELSFAVRNLGCIAGIVITASHNPPEYNGYKVYWEDGAQITVPKDKEIIAEVNRIEDEASVKTMEKAAAMEKDLYHIIGEEIDEAYLAELKKLVKNPEAIKKMAKELRIVYTPLHGTGNILVRRVLKDLGFEDVHVVPEQELPDGNFPTVKSPNPEDDAAFALALELAKKIDADIVLATDPDADRLGVYAKDTKTGQYMKFTGNMSGLLIAEYELSQLKDQGRLPKNGALIKTIVSSNMGTDIARAYDIQLIEVLTGFKYIGEQIKFFEQMKAKGNVDAPEYLFGYEESYGCLIGTYARDKDAVVAVMALCEAAAYYKTQNRTLWDQMLWKYETYGYYKEDLVSITLKGDSGKEKIENIMVQMRNNEPDTLGGLKVLAVRDYKADTRTDKVTGEVTKTGLPSSNVLYYELEDNSWCCVRPSGTEPKIKFYIGVKGNTLDVAESRLGMIKKELLQITD